MNYESVSLSTDCRPFLISLFELFPADFYDLLSSFFDSVTTYEGPAIYFLCVALLAL